VDFVVTDPPFFDNVHYSELADFFHAWQSLYPRGFLKGAATTRHTREVQDTDAKAFAAKLCMVFAECRRIVKNNGLLVFTYHHSRAEGWTSLAQAVFGAGFSIVNAHPVKAEMSVAAPKAQAKEPIQLDVVLVCKKIENDTREPLQPSEALEQATQRAFQKLSRLRSTGLKLSQPDRRIAVISQFLSALGPIDSAETVTFALQSQQTLLEEAADQSDDTIDIGRKETVVSIPQPQQMSFLFKNVIPQKARRDQ
jgi:putative DNA methylase